MRIVVTGGGTGGHIFPALEIAKELAKHRPDLVVSYVGNQGGLEERMALACNFHFTGLKTKPIVGQSVIKKISALLYLGLGVLKCVSLFLKDRPQAVIGVGGYVSAPVIIASFLLLIRRYLCEQNVVPGLANRLLAALANDVFISFKDSAQYFPRHKTKLTGNPTREQFFVAERKPNHRPLAILITGGSMGASFLNEKVPQALALIKNECPELFITHQTGQAKLSAAQAHYQKAGITARVVPFIEDMAGAFSQHDLLISRAGATVIAEITAAGMPAIVVPYRFAEGHQKANAQALVKEKAGLMIEEGDTFVLELARSLKELYHHQEQLVHLSHRARAMAIPNAAQHIVKIVLEDNNKALLKP